MSPTRRSLVILITLGLLLTGSRPVFSEEEVTGSPSEYNSWVASITVNGRSFERGSEVTATVECTNAQYCNNMVVGCSGAEKAWVRGVPTTTTSTPRSRGRRTAVSERALIAGALSRFPSSWSGRDEAGQMNCGYRRSIT